MDWYTARPEKLSKVYDEVFGKITKMNQEYSDKLKQFTQQGTKNIFQTNKQYVVKGELENYPEPFLIPLDGLGTYLIDIQLRLTENDKSINPRLEAYFTKDETDAAVAARLSVADHSINKSTFSRNFQFIGELNDKSYKYLKISVIKAENKTSGFVKDFQLSSLKVKRMPPPLTGKEEEKK
jgi:hypothetical protein